MGDFITLQKTGPIAVLTLNRPDRMNAIGTHEDCADFSDSLQALNADTEIKVAVLTGAGRAFCAGGDITGMQTRTGIGRRDTPAATRANYKQGVQRIPRAFQELEVPIIAAINGAAIGVGCDFACFCDIRIASTVARFAAGFVRMGLVPGDGGAWALPRAVGYSKAAEMLFTGDPLTAEQALACGLVSQVVEPDALLPAAMALAERIAGNPGQALRLAKRLLHESHALRLTEVLELSAAYQGLAHETADHEEAVAAFVEKRKPVFKGN
jgi:enoyl-CoA hydratase/carnithine racemase